MVFKLVVAASNDDAAAVSAAIRMHLVEAGRVDADGVAFHEDRAERLDTLTVKSWSTVEEYVLMLNHAFQNRPHFWHSVFNQPSCSTNVES